MMPRRALDMLEAPRGSAERFAFAKHCGRMAIAARVMGGHATAIAWWRGTGVAALHAARTLRAGERVHADG